MRHHLAVVLTMTAIFLSVSTDAGERPKYRLGAGLNKGISLTSNGSGSVVGGSEEDHDGYTVFGAVDFNRKWGLSISYRDLEGTTQSYEQQYEQISAHAVRRWRADRKVRPHIKFGLAQTTMETTGFFGSGSESGVGLSIGGGMEVGSKRVAFLLELDSTGVNLGDETKGIASWTTGVVFRF